MLPHADLKAIAAHLQEQAETNARCARQASLLGHPRSVDLHTARADQFGHWAAGIEELAATRALAAVDLPPPPPAGIEGLTDGPFYFIPATHDGLVHATPAASTDTFSPNC